MSDNCLSAFFQAIHEAAAGLNFITTAFQGSLQMPDERVHGIVRHRLSGPEGTADFFLGKFAVGSRFEQVKELLHRKWITPLVQNLLNLPNNAVDALVSELSALNQKYETTFAELESQIAETETQLSAMMDELTGSETDLLGLSELRKLLGGE